MMVHSVHAPYNAAQRLAIRALFESTIIQYQAKYFNLNPELERDGTFCLSPIVYYSIYVSLYIQ